MKRVFGIVFAVMMMSVVLAGCYSKACETPAPEPVSYKGENK